MQEATLVAQNNYSTPNHVVQEANIMVQRSIHNFFSYVCVFASIAIPFVCHDCLNVWVILQCWRNLLGVTP